MATTVRERTPRVTRVLTRAGLPPDPQLWPAYWNHACGCGVILPRHLARCRRCDTR